jgi:putative SOS response-associated peptidase YedK
MCGRATLVTPIDEIADQFGVSPIQIGPPRYNVAPGQPLVVVRLGEEGRELAMLNWGMRPFWSKKPYIQARAETVPSRFGDTRRCLVVVDGFYEWSSPPEGKRQPHHVHRPDGGLFSLAGIWDGESCAVITTAAKGPIGAIHDRMPLVIAPADRDAWLGGSTELLTRGEHDLVLAAVSTRVNDVKNDDAGCLAPPGPGDLGQIALPFR